jgi:serine protease Do
MRKNAVAWVAVAMSAAALVGSRNYTRAVPAARQVPAEGQKVARALSDAFGAVAEIVGPSVVQINVEKKVDTGRLGRMIPRGNGRMAPGMPGGGEVPKELEEMLKKFFGPDFQGQIPGAPGGDGDGKPRLEREQFVDSGTGSGFVFDDKGHILTNNHVVEGADKVVVTFHDGVQQLAKVVGTYPETDIAVIKVETTEYAPIQIGSSQDLKIGQWVLALGSPFGLDHTVTAGIISAKERQDVGINRFESFIQTDAAINPGNSGGPLVDLDGKVVGINSAIATASRSNSGVGFAIPIDMAVRVAKKLIRDGKISPALMGITIEPLNPGLAKQFGLAPKAKGLLVTEVGPGTPAAKAGFKQGDVIVSFDGQPVTNRQSLQYLVSTCDIGKSYPVEYFRDGKKNELSVAPESAETVASRMPRAAEERVNGQEEKKAIDAPKIEVPGFGFSVSPLTPEVARKFEWGRDAEGVVVAEIDPDGPAADSGLEVGDRITNAIRDKKFLDVKKPEDLASAAKGVDTISIQVFDVRKVLDPQFMTIEKAAAADSSKDKDKAPKVETARP